MSHLTQLQKKALKKFAEQFPDQIPPEGLLLSFRWGGICPKGRRYVKLTLLPSGYVQMGRAARAYNEKLRKELILDFIPASIWKELTIEKLESKIADIKAH